MATNRSSRRGNWYPVLVQCLAIGNLIVCGAQALVDICSFWSIKMDDSNSDAEGYMNSSGLSGIILLLIHLTVIVAQLYFGYCLLDSVKQRDFVGCRQWFMTSMNIYGIEFFCLLMFTFLAPRAEVFVGFTTISILYKVFQLWPIDGFILNLETYSEPLLGEEEFHM